MPFSQMDCVITNPETGMVIAVAVFNADAHTLFRALTDPAEIARWWGGRRGGSAVAWQGKPEIGGEWRAEGVFSRGRTFTASGLFLEIEPGKRMVQSWHACWDQLTPTEASFRFEAVEGGTMLSLVHKGFQGRDAACQTQAQFWWKVIKWLRSHLQEEGRRAAVNPAASPAVR
jgi:uncharacterized protein YndB with AHSA1/START domain